MHKNIINNTENQMNDKMERKQNEILIHVINIWR